MQNNVHLPQLFICRDLKATVISGSRSESEMNKMCEIWLEFSLTEICPEKREREKKGWVILNFYLNLFNKPWLIRLKRLNMLSITFSY